METEAQMQKILNLEGILILVAIGADIFIEALRTRDWIAAAVIIAGFCIIGGLYWHTIFLDRLFADLHEGLRRILPHHSTQTVAARTVVQDVPAAIVSDRPIVHVSNFPLSRNFYAAALAPLGYSITMELPALSMASFGIDGASDLWIKGDGVEQKIRAAFSANHQRTVDDFYSAALYAGGTEAEAPGARPERGAGYYAAAVYDPDGYTIEAVFRDLSAI